MDSHCPYLLSSETTAKGTGLAESAGKEDPVELDPRPQIVNFDVWASSILTSAEEAQLSFVSFDGNVNFDASNLTV